MRRLVMLTALVTECAFAQLAPTGAHYVGRAADTGYSGSQVAVAGDYLTSIPLDLPSARGELPLPLSIGYSARGTGAAGAGWDIPLSYVEQRRTFAHRRPAFRGGQLPEPRERTFLSLLGQQVELIQENALWIARTGSLAMRARLVNDEWRVYDGEGRTYVFVRLAPLGRARVWLLKSVSAAGGASVTLTYQLTTWAVYGDTGVEVNLVRMEYNLHPAEGCAKHEVTLTYGNGSTTPISLAFLGETPLVRYRVLTLVDVLSRASCQVAPERLRRYSLQYQPDADTTLPRLKTVLSFGRQGTAEEFTPMTVAEYSYGTASTGGRLAYRFSQTIGLPPEDEGNMISGTVPDSSISAPGGGDGYAMWQDLRDFTGDGRPDLVLKKNGQLWMAVNQPATNGDTTLGASGTVPLHDAIFQSGSLATHALRKGRFFYGTENNDSISVFDQLNGAFLAANYNTVNVWRQEIDVNGDGRVDIIDAAAEPLRWVIYLNTPGGPSGVVWKRTSVSVAELAAELSSHGHTLTDDRVPLSRRATSAAIKISVCWRWNGERWAWFSDGWGELCFGDPTRVLAREKERTYTEWELGDVNGDGYPDLLFNSTPTRFQLLPPESPPSNPSVHVARSADVVVPFAPSVANAVRVAYNIVGARFDTAEATPFALSVSIMAVSPELGVAVWENTEGWAPGGRQDVQRQLAGFSDANGDGLLDRVTGTKAYLGVHTGTARAFSTVYITLPGLLSVQVADKEAGCSNNGDRFTSRITQGLRDLTGDGIPDYFGDGRVSIGTGAGFAAPMSVQSQVSFVFSHQTETCDGTVSRTDGGLVDIDGDGQPEVIGLVEDNGHRAYAVAQLAAGASPRTPEAGRLITVSNGQGALTTISYRSAKEDMHSWHNVPFAEIVVSATQTSAQRGLGGALAGSRYGYGRAELHFDPARDAFVFPGYGRIAEVMPTGGPRSEGLAVVEDHWPLTPLASAVNAQQRWLRLNRIGRVRDVFTLRASAPADPWELLGVDPNDTRVIGVAHQEWDAKLYLPAVGVTNARDCMEMPLPYDFAGSMVGNLLNPCLAHGFVFGTTTQSWYGASAPPSTNNIQSLVRVREVDDFARNVFVEYEGDLFRNDDDVCVESVFAQPVQGMARILSALAQQRITDCTRRITYSAEASAFDDLPPGSVSAGRMTSHSVERRATDNGELLRTVREFDATYDAQGNLASTRTERGTDQRTMEFSYDPFGLKVERARVTATGVATTETRTRYDAVSMEPLAATDANGHVFGTEFDGFGRPRRSTLAEAGGPVMVTATATYLGFSQPDPLGRRIVTRDLAYPTSSAEEDSAPGSTMTQFFDELGRVRHNELALGVDYGGEILVIGSRTYDAMGRLEFEADPYESGADTAKVFGTTWHYKRDGELDCTIRGRGKQPLNNVTDVASERFPTCYQRYFIDHVDTLEVRDAVSLESGSPQEGVISRMVSSAIGRVLDRSTIKAGQRLDHTSFAYDRLGRMRSVTRFNDPVGATGPVQSAWRLDSVGQTIELREPDAAVRFNTFSDWGELTETRWNEAAALRRLTQSYDALGRLTRMHASNDGVVDPATINEYHYDTGIVSALLTPTNVRGRLAQARSETGTVTFSYDALGRVDARQFHDRQNETYLERAAYRLDGQLSTLVLQSPDNSFAFETIKYDYDSADRLRSISFSDAGLSRDLFKADRIDALGRVRTAMYGATHYRADYAQEGRRLLNEIAVESARGMRRIYFLRYDANGREMSRREVRDAAVDGPKTNVAYDQLGRLASSFESLGATTLETRLFRYNELGNLTGIEDPIGNDDVALSLGAPDLDRLCRIGYGNGGLGGSACNVAHDVLGNVVEQPTRRGTRRVDYLPDGAVRSVSESGVEAEFRYDAFGQVQELDVQGGPSGAARHERRYGSHFEKREVQTATGPTSLITRYIPGAGRIVASRRGPGDEWVFEFGEERGKRIFTGKEGEFLQDVNYEPFGSAASAGSAPGTATYTQFQWNDGDALEAFGLSYLGSRLYDPVIGRFLSRDPLLTPRSAANTNPYAFAGNDPLNNSDPTGLDGLEGLDPLDPITPFGSAGGGGSDNEQCSHGPCSRPDAAPPPPSISRGPPGPAISPSVFGAKLALNVLLVGGKITPAQASAKFRDYVRENLYSYQKESGGVGYCVCASKHIALKFGGIIRPGVGYAEARNALESETSPATDRAGKNWQHNHFVLNFEKPWRLNGDAMSQVARNAAIGTGSTEKLRWQKLSAKEARAFMDMGGVVVVSTGGHWMAALHDPFKNRYLLLDPWDKKKWITEFKNASPMDNGDGPIIQYQGLFRD